MSKKNHEITLDDMADFATRRVLMAFGKGTDLRGELIGIIIHAATWGADNRERDNKKD